MNKNKFNFTNDVKFMQNKGVSPLIATVILIGFVVIIIAIIILWGKDYLQEKAEKSSALEEAARDCLSVDISVETITGKDGFLIYNDGNIPFDGLIIRQHCGGDIAATRVYTTVNVGASLELVKANAVIKCGGEVSIPSILYDEADSFEVIPAKRPAGKGAPLVPCSDKKQEVKLSQEP